MANKRVVIVGSGVAGALVAYELSKKGIPNTIIEAGPREEDRGQKLMRFYESPIHTPNIPYLNNPKAPSPRVINPNSYYVQKGPETFQSSFERLVGGSTWHWLGTAVRLVPSDFTMQSTFGHAVDWPIQYKDLSEWYEKAERELGVSGDNTHDSLSPRVGSYPNPAFPLSVVDQAFRRGLAGKSFEGIPLKVGANPQARNPRVCQSGASCVPICPTGAKYEALTHVRKAEALGTQVISEAVVHQIHSNREGKITHLTYRRWDGSDHTIEGGTFVLAANAIENAKLLLQSKQEYAPHGVANRSRCVGRYLMDHPVQISRALAKEPVFPYRGPGITAGIDSVRDGSFRKERASYRFGIHNDGWAWNAGSPHTDLHQLVGRGQYGSKLREALKFRLQRQISSECLIEQLPNWNNRVEISKLKDPLGISRPAIFFSLGDYEHRGIESAKKLQGFVFRQLGASEIDHEGTTYGSGHLMGTHRMGKSSQDSVTDQNLKTHDHPNLYLTGSGTFPTAGNGNPTLTIAALSVRCAAEIARLV